MATTIARADGRAGELALRAADGHLELISNGVFLMDTRDGRSERLLVSAAVEHAARPVRRVVLGGLGVGFSLAEALDTPGVDEIVVVEREPLVVDWNRQHTAAVTGGSVDAPGVRCVVADLVDWVRAPAQHQPYDVIAVDIDNGPDWLVEAGNGWIYRSDGLRALHDLLSPGGVLSVWSAAPAPALADRLARRFDDVRTTEIEVPRGAPDVVVVARRRA